VAGGYAVCAFDLRGHGKSEGRKGYVARFTDYLEDLDRFCDLAHREYAAAPLFLVGHSVGGLIAVSYATTRGNSFQGLVLSAPTLKPGESVTPLTMTLASVLSSLTPGIGVSTIDASAVSRDRGVVEAYVSDPLVYRGKISARLGAELIRAMKELPPKLPKIRLPLLILHGTADRLSNIDGSSMLYRLAGSGDKTLKKYEGLFHEVFNEPESENVLRDVESWLEDHLMQT
jgi:alpha-beta hydrolase superfamily lysophospholipase